MRYYLGVDWADQTHAVWVVDEQGTKVANRTVPHTASAESGVVTVPGVSPQRNVRRSITE